MKKGAFELPLIFNELYKKNTDVQLILIGRDASDIQSGNSSTWKMMQELFDDRALKNVNYLGSVPYDEIKNHIAKASVCVFPTFAEALPVSWIEAMTMNKAIVASNIGWANEVIEDSLFSQHFGACTNNTTPACSCTSEGVDQCNISADLFTTCFNDINGTANKLQFVDTTNPCSESHLNGNCPNSETHHCEVTSSGVKCVPNTCSNTNVNGTCKAGYYCNGGICMQKEEILYSAKVSTATAGKRYLEFYDLLKEAQSKDVYKYPICLEDFGSPLFFIGAKLTE